jgi:hypothetical protein
MESIMQTGEEKDLAAQSALHLQPADHLLPQDSPSVYANCKNALVNRSSVSQSVNRFLSCSFPSYDLTILISTVIPVNFFLLLISGQPFCQNSGQPFLSKFWTTL